MLTRLRVGLFFSLLSWVAGLGLTQSGSPSGPLVSGSEAAISEKQDVIVELRQLIDELVQNNPDIRGGRQRYDAASKRPSQLSTLPDPKLTFVNFGVGHPLSALHSTFAYRGFGVSQEIPFPGKLALAGQEARKEADSEGEMYRATVLETIAHLKLAYYDWFYVSKAIEVTNKNRDLLDRFEKIARARYAVGKGIQQDVLKAQVELSGLEQQLEILRQRRASIEAQINSLLNRDPGTPVGRPAEVKRSPFELELTSLLGLIEKASPRLRAKQLLVDSRGVGVDRAKKEYRPDFNFNFQWQRTGSLFPDYYMAAVEVKLPLYFWRKQRYGVEEAAARLRESRESYQATRQESLFMAKDQYLVAKTSGRLLALFESGIIPQAALSLESAVAGYEVGSVDFLTLINNLTTLLNFEMQYYEELAKHEQALARLEPLVARTLTDF